MVTTSIYREALAAGLEMGNHESDLYLLDGDQARAILNRHGATSATLFRSETDGQFWWDVPFMFEPFWSLKTRL